MTAPDPPPLAYEVAALLDALGVARFDPTGPTGDVFVLDLPAEPDAALRVSTYAGPDADGKLGYDTPNVQVWVRGGQGDPVGAARRAQRVYDALHGLRRRVLPGGTRMQSCFGLQSGPVDVGADQHGRHELTVNFSVSVRRRTANRK